MQPVVVPLPYDRVKDAAVFEVIGVDFTGPIYLKDFEKLARTVAIDQIEWKFNPPTAAWWGRFWERLNGILKRLLRRTLRKSSLNYEEMMTVLLDCEAIINSRPITFLSENKQDLVPLTPSMFLQDTKEIGVLDLDRVEKCDFAKRYNYRAKIKEGLRRRFRTEYLGASPKHCDGIKDCRMTRSGRVSKKPDRLSYD
ncbi:uncharacterized protein LOC122520403 [Polistes fuscatus]|uniref:uncharacterized protein LOC122520403 n=1 Tax=Polistes fuscatus TaxID=30207 RepID=UPI001CAA0722|nr:uncharacterized protein LOC122520403 [Polistes fuscatus]